MSWSSLVNFLEFKFLILQTGTWIKAGGSRSENRGSVDRAVSPPSTKQTDTKRQKKKHQTNFNKFYF